MLGNRIVLQSARKTQCVLVPQFRANFHNSARVLNNNSSNSRNANANGAFFGSKFGAWGKGAAGLPEMQRTAPPKPTEDNAAAKRAGLTGHKFNANTSNTRGKVSRPPMPKAGTNRSANKISAADIIQQKIQRRLEKVKKEDNDGKDRLPRDEEIQSAMITLISLDGTIEGIRPLSQVLNELDREQYTLMMVNAQEQPPACRVFSRKILYEREKQAKKQKKLASKSSSKPQIIQLNANIGDHDLGIKLKKTLGLLEKGKRVTIVIEKRSFNARKNDRVQEIAPVIMSQVEGHCSIVNSPSVEGTTWSVSLQGKAKTK